MKQKVLTRLSFISIFVALFLMVAMLAAPVSAANTATVTLLNPPADGVLVLAVGESYTFDIQVESDTPFLSAIALTDQYYPGRGVFFSGTDRIGSGTSGTLHLTITGKQPSATAQNVVDGLLPVGIVVGVRYQGGYAEQTRFDFTVIVE